MLSNSADLKINKWLIEENEDQDEYGNTPANEQVNFFLNFTTNYNCVLIQY